MQIFNKQNEKGEGVLIKFHPILKVIDIPSRTKIPLH